MNGSTISTPRDTYLRGRRRAIRDAEFALLSRAAEFPDGSPARRRAVLRARVFREVARLCVEGPVPVPFVLLRGRTGWPPDSQLDAALSWLVREEWLVITNEADPLNGTARRYDIGHSAPRSSG